MVKCESRNHACAREQFTQLYKSCVWLERCISWAVLLPFASRWMCWSRSSLSCFSRSTPPETSRASDWPTTISSATCSLSPSSSWSRYEALELYLLLNFFFSGSFNKRFCPQVFHCLNEILELCHNFCSLVSQSVASLDERGTAQLDILVKVEPLISICPSNAGKCKVHSYEHVQISGLQTAVLLTV